MKVTRFIDCFKDYSMSKKGSAATVNIHEDKSMKKSFPLFSSYVIKAWNCCQLPVGLSCLFFFSLQWLNSSVFFKGMYLHEREDFFPPLCNL